MKPFTRAFVIVLLCAFAFCIASSAQADLAVRMKDARISPPGGGGNFFWTLAASPTNPEHVVACPEWNNPYTGHFLQNLIYGSTDGGESWQLLKTATDVPDNSEVTCAMNGDNGIYFSVSVGPFLPKTLSSLDRMHTTSVWHSRDFGKSWRRSDTKLGYTDSAVLVDESTTAGGDRLFDFYSMYSGNPQIGRYLSIYENGGAQIRTLKPYTKTFCESRFSPIKQPTVSVTMPERPGACRARLTMMAATKMAHGEVGALYSEYTLVGPPRTVLTFSRLSADGNTATLPSVIASSGPEFAKVIKRGDFSSNFEPALAWGPLSQSSGGRLYVAWHDMVDHRPRVVLTTSDDKGLTWTKPRPIDDDGTPAADPSLAVNKQGIVAAMWAESSGNCWRIAFSEDGGRQFQHSLPLNPCAAQTNFSLADALVGHLFMFATGDLQFEPYLAGSGFGFHDFRKEYQRLIRGLSLAAAPDGSFYAVWAALGSRDDELHSTRITFSNHDSSITAQRKRTIANAVCCVTRNGPTGHVQLYFTSFDYDPATREFVAGAVLARERGYGGKWPLVLRAKKITSKLGNVRASNSDNDTNESGAAWVFDGPGANLPASSAAATVKLLPQANYEYSKPRVLRFRLNTDLHELPALRYENGAAMLDQTPYVDVSADVLSSP